MGIRSRSHGFCIGCCRCRRRHSYGGTERPRSRDSTSPRGSVTRLRRVASAAMARGGTRGPLPPPLPPETRTVGQLVAETIRLYAQRFWLCLPLGVSVAALDVVAVNLR